MAEDAQQTGKEEIPTPIRTFPQTHPGRLAVIGKIFGMDPAPIDGSRVLELGCLQGGNLLPLAQNLSESEFLGIDSSSESIGMGQKIIDAVGLKNIRLLTAEISEIDETVGPFDYIVAHGLYSWVAPDIQEEFLEFIHSHLADQGIAYVSYNTYPGWRMRAMLRDMMLYHTGSIEGPRNKAGQARALTAFLSESAAPEETPFGAFLKSELDSLRTIPDGLLLRDYLAEFNDPIYFHEFNRRANGHGLRYLGEAEFHTMLAYNFPPKVFDTLKKLKANLIATEQYMDFLRNRTFRQTLLCRQEVALDRNIEGSRIDGFMVSSRLTPKNESLNLEQGVEEQFSGPGNLQLTTADALTKAFYGYLAGETPRLVPFGEARDAALKATGMAGSDEEGLAVTRLRRTLIQCYTKNLVEFNLYEPLIVREPSPCPRVTPVARFQAAAGLWVTNQRHASLNLDIFSRRLLTLLDGANDRSALYEKLQSFVDRGALTVKREEQTVTDPTEVDEILRGNTDHVLDQLARNAFLVD